MGAGTPEPTRGRLREWLRAHPWMTGGAAVLTAAGIAVVLVWFQPQTLLFDTVVDEDFPTAVATGQPGSTEAAPGETDDAAASEADQPSGPVALATGAFASRNRYTVTGTATVYALEGGARTLRLEDFSSTNGPDLFVYLTAADHADADDDLAADFIDLGRLRGNVGNQNYDIPDGADLDRYDTVVIWCLRFTTSFGAADLR